MRTPPYSTWRTSKTLRQILKGPDCPERRERVRELVSIYQPVWEETAKWALRQFGDKNATLDASEIVGNEAVKMLDPDSEYFRTYDSSRSLRSWIKGVIKHRTIDHLRRRSHNELDESQARASIEQKIEVRELYEILRRALKIAGKICEDRSMQEEWQIFRAVRTAQDRLSPEERRQKKGWTEWQERKAVSQVWEIIRDDAIPQAAQIVSDRPKDVAQIASELWEKMKNHKTIDLPESMGGRNE